MRERHLKETLSSSAGTGPVVPDHTEHTCTFISKLHALCYGNGIGSATARGDLEKRGRPASCERAHWPVSGTCISCQQLQSRAEADNTGHCLCVFPPTLRGNKTSNMSISCPAAPQLPSFIDRMQRLFLLVHPPSVCLLSVLSCTSVSF